VKTLKNIVIIYHGSGCRDGFGSAYAAWKKFGDAASYLPMDTRNIVPDGLVDKEIYILDYAFSKEQLAELIDKNISVLVIDHHISDQAAVTSFPSNIFDINHSGAVLSWRYFHPDSPVPPLLKYIEDHDIWKFELPHNREFNVALGDYEMDFAVWDTLITKLRDEEFYNNYLEKGRVVAEFEDRLVEGLLKFKERVLFEGHEVYALNVSKRYRSILGHKLATLNKTEGRIALGIIYYHAKGKVNISLRSEDEVDVSEIAAKYGGGGHKNAAGLEVASFADLPFEFIKD
jgi:oligoribonuclease NrnB/cAMP/cGMP phosphodiesterase (DHH superfamily)